MSNTFTKLILAIFLTQAALNITAYAQSEGDPWTLSKKTESITLYRMVVPGLDIDAFKGVCEYKVRLEVVGAVLENIPGYVKWIYSLTESRVVEKKNEDHLLLYHLYDVIWPFSDRDIVGEAAVERDYQTGKFVIRLHSISDPLVPLKENTIRVPAYTGTFIVEYIDREHTRITYIAQIDFGGAIPKWFGNLLSGEIPYKMLTGLINETQKKEYIKAAETSELKRRIEESLKNGNLK